MIAKSARAIRWLPLVAGAAIGGWVVRGFRRLCNHPPRIWHGMYPIHSVAWLKACDQASGYPSRAVVNSTSRFAAHLHHVDEYDLVFEERGRRPETWHWRCLVDLLWNADIWVAFFECLIFPVGERQRNRLTFVLLKLVGIRLICVPHGHDIIHRVRQQTRFDWIGRAQGDYPLWDLSAEAEVIRERTALFCRFADFVVSADSTTTRLLPRQDVTFKYFPVDCKRLRPVPGTHPVPLIVHAPNHRLTKGTDSLLGALAELRSRNIDYELALVENIPREEAFQSYGSSDIIADQFCIGAFGMFALEGLALGKPVLTYLDEEHLGDPIFNLPLVNTNSENIDGVLAVLLLVPELRERLGKAGRESVEKYQSIPALAQVWDRIYRHVWWGAPLKLETTTHFSPERKSRSFTEDPSRQDFWPVPVADLLPEIHAALERAGFSSGGNSRAVPADITGVEIRA
jgi:glycosyltransferase involved in cell wall biosynthesis